jgi:hypothetical protein
MARLKLNSAFCSMLLIAASHPAQIRPTIIDDSFTVNRPQVRKKTTPHKKPLYRLASPGRGGRQKPEPNPQAEVGVTLWWLQPSSPGQPGARMLVHEPAGASFEAIPKRIEAETQLSEGGRVRLTVESPRSGYLYVIDREEYTGGAKGLPYLIFPTTRTRGGDNKVEPGKLIEIPGINDDPNYFTVKRSRPDETGELLTIIVSEQPLENIAPSNEPVKLTKEQVAAWERLWGAAAERLELVGGAGKPWTEQEKAAGNPNSSERLNQEDPLPQTIYRVHTKSSQPILVNVPLRTTA